MDMDNRDILEYFVRSGERSNYQEPNPLFCGRDAELAALRQSVKRLRAAKPGSPNCTHIVQGAPGAGKTELMTQFMNEVNSLGEDARTFAIAPPNGWVADGARLLKAIYTAAIQSKGPLATLLNAGTKQIPHIRAISAFGVSVAFDRESQRVQMPIDALVDGIEDMPDEFKEYTYVLCMDESQNLSRQPFFEDAILPDHIEQGTVSLKLMPVFFGLGNTQKVLSDIGLSRLNQNQVLSISTLRNEDVSFMSERFVEALGASAPTGEDARRYLDMVAEMGCNWPQHLSHTFGSSARWAAGNPGMRMDVAAIKSIRDTVHNLKQSHYQAVLEKVYELAANTEMQIALGTLFARDVPPLPDEVRTHIHTYRNQAAGDRTTNDIYLDMVATGIIHTDNDNRCRIPIPSLVKRLCAERH